LVGFAQRWSVYRGSERAEAQTFLNELFACYGTDRREVARFEEPQEGKFLDLIWPRVCLIEMKRPSESRRLATHRRQALDYWQHSADPGRNVPAPRYVVLCSFDRFEVWEPGLFPGEPRIEMELRELPERLDALMFLAGRTRSSLPRRPRSRAKPWTSSQACTGSSETGALLARTCCATSSCKPCGACSPRTSTSSRAACLAVSSKTSLPTASAPVPTT
jgi:hypothetical protein